MISPERFNGALIWQGLSDEDQNALGPIALELAAAWFCMERSWSGALGRPEARHIASDAAVRLADKELGKAFLEIIPRDELADGEGRLRFPSLLGLVCLSCGCSQNDACSKASGWAGPHLCTACKANAGSGVSPPEPAS